MAPVRTRKKGRGTLYSSPYKRHMGTFLRQPPVPPSLAPSIPALPPIAIIPSAGKVGIPLQQFLASAALSSAVKIINPPTEKAATPPQEPLAGAATTALRDLPAETILTIEKLTISLEEFPPSAATTTTATKDLPAANTSVTTCIGVRAVRKPVAAQFTFNDTPSLFARGTGRARKNVGRPIPFKLFQRPPDNGGMRLREDPVKGTVFNGGMFAQFLKESSERESDAKENDERGSPMKLDSPVKVDVPVQVPMPGLGSDKTPDVGSGPPHVKPKLPPLFQRIIPTLTGTQSGPMMSNVNRKVSQDEDEDAKEEEETDANKQPHIDAHTHVGQVPWVDDPTYLTTATRGAVPVGNHLPSLLAAIERGKTILALETPLPVPPSAGCTPTPNRRQSLAYDAVVEFLTPKAEIKDATPMMEKKDEFAASPAFNLTQRGVRERRLGPIEGAVQGWGGRSRVRVVATAEGVNIERYGLMMRRL